MTAMIGIADCPPEWGGCPCFPRFGPPTVFARILDPSSGPFAIQPVGDFEADPALQAASEYGS